MCGAVASRSRSNTSACQRTHVSMISWGQWAPVQCTMVSLPCCAPWMTAGKHTTHGRSMNIATDPSRLPGLCLDAVIDGTQTGPRVRFDISEPPQQGARERVDRLIGERGFIPVANGWTPPLCLPALAPANFLCVGPFGAAHLETFVEVRSWLSVQG